MKNQALFSSKDKSKKLKCRLLQFVFGALSVKSYITLLSLNIPIFIKAPQLQESLLHCYIYS